MRDERARRRPSFSRGTAIRLADGQDWWLPLPGDLAPSDVPGVGAGSPPSPVAPDYPTIVAAVVRPSMFTATRWRSRIFWKSWLFAR